MSTNTPNPNPHILVFPYPAQGHMLALLDLAHHLSLQNFTITILITPKNLPFLSPLLSSHPNSITPLLLPFPTHPSIPVGVENVKDLGNAGNIPMMAALQKLHDPLVHWFGSHPNPPVAIISDFFLGWTHRLAVELNIPRIAFHSISAFLICIMRNLWNDVEKYKSLEEIRFGDLPGSPVFKQDHLPTIFRLGTRLPDTESQSLPDCFTGNNLSWGSIFNSFESLEGKYLNHLRKKAGHNRVFGIGPLSLTGLDSSARGRGDSDPNSDNGVFTWLDRCPDRSVVYVCFGSQKLLCRKQMEALSSGPEKSGTRFIWVVKTGTPEQTESRYGSIPDGFEKRVASVGRVVTTWASQVMILSHKAVRGFLSHCGWNSVLEAIASGVMILAWPMEADQFQNSRLLVEDMGVAVKVCEGADSVTDLDELGRVIGESMRERGGGGGLKLRAEELREEAFAAIAEGGTSTKDLNRLVEELRQL